MYEGQKALRDMMRDKELRQKVLMANSSYYLVMGICFSFIQSTMKDAVEKIKSRGAYRHQVKYFCKKATDEVDHLLKQIENVVGEAKMYSVGGVSREESSQFWIDTTDNMEEMFRPKIERLRICMEAYMKKLEVDDYSFRSYVCLVSMLLYYCTEILYPSVRDGRLQEVPVDLLTIFENGDGKTVKSWWDKVEQQVAWEEKDIDFGKSPSCKRAVASIDKLFNDERLYRKSLRYAERMHKEKGNVK